MKRRLLTLLLVSLFPGILFGATTGKIAGVVTDKETGDPLPGANIVIEGSTMGAASNTNGEYYILNVPAGRYVLRASMIGYQSVRIANVLVHGNLTTSVDFQLSGTVLLGEEVSIVAERPLIQRDGVTSMAVTTSDEIQSMVADNVVNILTLNSGVVFERNYVGRRTSDTGEGHIRIRGGRDDEVAYMIDGMKVENAVQGGLGTEFTTPAIEELQVISGNFSAEYGNAMSGVVNLVTPDAKPRLSGRMQVMTDNLGQQQAGMVADPSITPEEEYFPDRLPRHNRTSNFGTTQLQASFNGPVPLAEKSLQYFFSGEYFQTDDYIGMMQDNIKRFGYGKIIWRIRSNIKTSIAVNAANRHLELYDNLFKYYPEGNDRLHTRTTQVMYSWTHALNAKSFYEIKLQSFRREFFDGVLSNPDNYQFLLYTPREDFAVAGHQGIFIDEDSRTYQGKLDYTYQLNAQHNLKAGIDVSRYRIWRHSEEVEGDVLIPLVQHFKFYPLEAAAYLQDKIELKDMVINAGVRVDYFNSNLQGIADENHPLTSPREDAEVRIALSPRLGVAFPVTDKSNIHFSYGHFYQQAPYYAMFWNQGVQLDYFRPTLGNPNLKPQRTIAFEAGWDQRFGNDLGLTITGFYKDIENLLASDIRPFAQPLQYSVYINQDFANSRGVEITARTRRIGHVLASLSYTFSRTEGNSSNPLDTRNSLYARPPREPVKRLVTMPWDRPHVANFNIDYRFGKDEGPRLFGAQILSNFGCNITGRFSSGRPYTPTDYRGGRVGEIGSARTPSVWTLDLRAEKLFEFGGEKIGVFTEILNLTNRANVLNVFSATGRPDVSGDPEATYESEHPPTNWGPQRNIRLGAEVTF